MSQESLENIFLYTTNNMKKSLIIVGIVLLLSFVTWFLLQESETPIPISPSGDSPFGSSEDINIPAFTTETVGNTTLFDDQNVSGESDLFRIANSLVAGYAVFTRDGETIVRYADRGTGHIMEVSLPKTGSTTGLIRKKVSNNTLPKIYEAHFKTDGSSVLLRSLNDNSDLVKNISLTLTAPKSISTDALYTVTVTNLRGDVNSVSTGANNIFYYVDRNNSSIASTNFIGGDQRTLFTSAFNNWRLGRFGNNLLVYTKGSAEASGYAYSLPIGGGNLSKLLGPLPGLTLIANYSATKLLYSYTDNGLTKLFVKNLQNNSTFEILPASLAEKCVWSSKASNIFYCGTPLNGLTGSEPDNWYLGITHFTDYIWRFDTTSESAQVVSEPKTKFNVDLDVSELKISPQEDFLIFINKRDQTLWATRLK